MEEKKIVNKVAQKNLTVIDIADFIPKSTEIAFFDIKPFLFKELVLKEADFREAMENHDWQQYTGKYTAVFCSNAAIIPNWAFMIIAAKLHPFAKVVAMVSKEQALNNFLVHNIQSHDFSEYSDKRVVVKGCGDIKIDANAYLLITNKLTSYARVILYGEPCSTVPVYKKAIN